MKLDKKQIQQSLLSNVYVDKDSLKLKSSKVPVYKGCQNTVCHCTGDCKEIVGFRNRHPLEL